MRKIKLKYSTYIKDIIGVEEETTTIDNDITIRELIERIANKHGIEVYKQLIDEKNEELKHGVIIAVNGKTVQKLSEKILGEEVFFSIASTGG
ncbi:MAG: MoaD/ThiS family protein [Candidatus Methanomethylicia archaeon]